MSLTTTIRRQKWHYPQPQTPRILHLPTRSRRKPPRAVAGETRRDRKGPKLETLFDQERAFAKSGAHVPIVLLEHYGGEGERRRERIEHEESKMESLGGGGGGGGEELVVEKWRFQAEVLRAECNLLRMEREIALRKLERSKVNMERTIRSATQALVNARKKISEGKDINAVLEEEMERLVNKLKGLRKSSKVEDSGAKTSSNFDKEVNVLERRLGKLCSSSEKKGAKVIQRLAESSLPMSSSYRLRSDDENGRVSTSSTVEIFGKKLEELSEDVLLDKMDNYRLLASRANSSVGSCSSTYKQIDCLGSSASLSNHSNQEALPHVEGWCSGHCKAVVRRIVEQVRAETVQWSQLQEMLGQVRVEMEELQASRDFWEDHALDSDCQIQSLNSSVQEWREKALCSDEKVKELQAEVSALREKFERSRSDQNADLTQTNSSQSASQEMHHETEKRVLICHLKENHNFSSIHTTTTTTTGHRDVVGERRRKVHTNTTNIGHLRRYPFQNIGNTLPLRQKSHCNSISSAEHCAFK